MDNYNIDTLIIGSGYAGLYAAHRIKQSDPYRQVVIVERESRIGGRAWNAPFCGQSIVVGAGVGRWDKDHLLRKLMRDMHFTPQKYVYSPAFKFEPRNVKRTMAQLLREFGKKKNACEKRFRDFAEPILGKSEYALFVKSTGYSDYENEDARAVLYDYGMDDNYADKKSMFSVPWELLANAIVQRHRIDVILNAEAMSIEETPGGGHTVKINRGRYIMCNTLIVATTVSVLRKLFPHNPVYRNIFSQPFLRIYAKFTATTAHIMAAYVQKYTIVPTILQKLIPIHPAHGIYMIAYCDNKNAVILNRIEKRETFCRLIEKSLGIPPNSLQIDHIKKYFWQEGTHYFSPLDQSTHNDRDDFIDDAQMPQRGVFVVGEAVSRHQGWVEGALESVDRILGVALDTGR